MQPPLIEPLPYRKDSIHYLSKVRHMGRAVFLDSCASLADGGRYDIVSAAPAFSITHKYSSNTSTSPPTYSNPYKKIRSKLDTTRALEKPPNNLPFMGGFIGYLGYESGMELEQVKILATDKIELPDVQLGWYEWAIVNDHFKHECFLVSLPGFAPDQFSQIKSLLINDLPDTQTRTPFALNGKFVSNMPFSDYQYAFKKIIDYIHAGDCYQVNLSQQFSASYHGDTLDAYQQLRVATPSPYSAFIELDEGALLSLSPEQFITLEQLRVTTQPIKGTRPRGKTAEDDYANAKALQESDKDRAENLMIVDLLRNDLGKSCTPGSVEVLELCKLQSFSNVHHLVSSITGTLNNNSDSIDLLTGCFPGGSITGAPKRRAMEIIAELEPHRRSVYCGSIGYISANGDMNFNIAIRTLVCNKNKIYCWGGGGIVADSEVEMEYQESFDKIDRLINCLPLA
ncbi:MAG: aminodeoxychorismate synthase component I [Pseudomonadales bacterium]|nr:aminodeoxychorismate synthase component I [Pseudomonadales bacterium]